MFGRQRLVKRSDGSVPENFNRVKFCAVVLLLTVIQEPQLRDSISFLSKHRSLYLRHKDQRQWETDRRIDRETKLKAQRVSVEMSL